MPGFGLRIADCGLKKSARTACGSWHGPTDSPPAPGLRIGVHGVARAVPNPQSAICIPDSLDRMKPGHAFLGTTNLGLTSLTERLQTRFQSVRLQPPDNESLAAFLARRWGGPITITRQIAEGAKGHVRAAMADLEMWMG